jgi:phosphatidylglycerophosphatase C
MTPPAVAIFDLDGTITRRDTFVSWWVGWIQRRPARFASVPFVLPALLRFAVDRDRGALKGALLRTTMCGVTRIEVEAWTASFVPHLLACGLHEQALRAIEAHRERGERLVLLSASPDLYVPAIGAALGFDEVICTPVRWDGTTLDGHLAGDNVRGEVKADRVRALKARHPGVRFTAYGNSGSDLPHLALVDRGVLVNGPAAARRAAQAQRIETVDWR